MRRGRFSTAASSTLDDHDDLRFAVDTAEDDFEITECPIKSQNFRLPALLQFNNLIDVLYFCLMVSRFVLPCCFVADDSFASDCGLDLYYVILYI